MGGKSIAHMARSREARFRMNKLKMADIFNPKITLEKYPKCAGSMKDCPENIQDLKNPPEQCRKCPQFMESKYAKELLADRQVKRAKELAELFGSIKKN